MLVAARKTTLTDALSAALGTLDPALVKKQIAKFAPGDAQRILASAGIRDEHVSPVPALLRQAPTLVGYYRLLLGISQKRFYRRGTGMSPYAGMEKRGIINPKKPPDLGFFCNTMAVHLTELVRRG